MTVLPLSPTGDRGRPAIRHDTRRRELTVLARTPLSERYVRFTLGGDALAGFASIGPDDHVKLFFPTATGQASRHYTPADFRTAGESGRPELDIEFVLHGDSGPASAWALRAETGSTLELGGPRGSRLAPAGFADALLIADPTGLPALLRWVRTYRLRLPLRVVLFGDGAADLTALLDGPERDAGRVAIVTEAELESTVRATPITADTFVWAAGDAAALLPVRRYLKHDLALPAANRSLHGYWRRGVADFDHHAPLDATDPD